VTFGEPIVDATGRDLPAELLAFWTAHGQLDASRQPDGPPACAAHPGRDPREP
jgi:hypothetical protein